MDRIIPADIVHRRQPARARHQRVPAQIHRRRAGMRGLALERGAHSAHRIAAGDDADIAPLGIQDRTLFDMQFEIGVDLARLAGAASVIADALQFVAEPGAVIADQVMDPIHRIFADETARRDHRRREPGTFLVGPVHDDDGAFGDMVRLVQGANDLQPRQNARDAIEATAVYLGVQVAADQDRRQAVIAACPPREDRAAFIDFHAEPRILAPGHELVAHFLVGIRQRQTRQAARPSLADPTRGFDGLPEAVQIDAAVRGDGHGRSLILSNDPPVQAVRSWC